MINSKRVILVQAYGALSYLEARATLAGDLVAARLVCEDVAILDLKDAISRQYEHLAGIHKIAIPATKDLNGIETGFVHDIASFLSGFDDGFNFSVSLYCYSGNNWQEEYERVCREILTTIRDLGFRKANLIRPRGSAELRGTGVLARKALDFVVLQQGYGSRVALTAYVPEAAEFEQRSSQRPVVSAKISLSSRLARLLVNLSGAGRRQLVLDPFCGTGTILGEAIRSGINCIGVDRSPGRVENSRRNLSWIVSTSQNTGSYELHVGDSTKLDGICSGRPVDAIVTEPILLPKMTYTPSLEKAKKLVRNASKLYSESLYSMAGAVRLGGRIVIVTPSLRTKEEKEVTVLLENTEDVGLRPFQPGGEIFTYPIRLAHESTRWVKRLVYVFERF